MTDQNTKQPGLHSRALKSAQWLLLDNIIQKALNILTFLILAHFLQPADYGIIAVLFMVTGFFDTVTTPGFEKALLQRPREATATYLDTAWTFNLLKSFGLSLIIFLAAPFVAHLFHIEDFTNIIQIGAWLIFISSLTNSHQIYFFKDFEYHKIFLRDILSQLGYMAVAFFWIIFIDASAWGLLAGHVARYIVSVIMTYLLSSGRPSFSFQFNRLKDLFGYSKWAMGQNIVGYILGILDSVYVARLLDSARLGLYTKARDLSFSLVSPFFIIISKVGFSAYAEIQDENAKLQDSFLRTLDIMLGLTIPIFFLFLAEGGLIVNTLLGVQWTGIVIPLKILAASTIFSSIATVTKPIFDGIGRPDINLKLNTFQLIISIPLIFFGIKFLGVNGVAWAVAVVWVILALISLISVKSILKLGGTLFLPTILTLGGALGTTLAVAIPIYLTQAKHQDSPLIVSAWLVLLGIVYFFSIKIIGQRFTRGPWQTWLQMWRELKKTYLPAKVL